MKSLDTSFRLMSFVALVLLVLACAPQDSLAQDGISFAGFALLRDSCGNPTASDRTNERAGGRDSQRRPGERSVTIFERCC